jgi:hypothetical protein
LNPFLQVYLTIEYKKVLEGKANGRCHGISPKKPVQGDVINANNKEGIPAVGILILFSDHKDS